MSLMRTIRFGLGVLIVAGLGWQLARQDPSALDALRAPSATALAVASTLAITSYFAFVRAWSSLRGRGESWRDVGGNWFASLFARYAPGGPWQGAVRVAGAHFAGESRRTMVERYLAEQGLACFSAATIALALVLVARVSLDRSIVLALAAIAAGALGVATLAPRCGFALQWTRGALVATMAGHLVLAAGFAAFVAAWDAGPALGDIGARMAMFLVAGIAGLLALFVPAGIGVREAVLAGLLAPQVGAAPAIAIALASRLWLLVCELGAWGVWFVASRRPGSPPRAPGAGR